MNSLEFSIKQLIYHNRDGAEATQANRNIGLFAMADELRTLGYGLKSAHNIKPQHVLALVGHWKAHGITDATIRNRLGWVRWLADRVGKPGLVPKDNESFGLAPRTSFRGNRARKADAASLAGVRDENVRLALRLERAFGLRREEALKFRPSVAVQGDCIALQASWCKGGRARVIPIVHEAQRALLAEVAQATGGSGSLVPPGKTYRRYLQTYKHQTRAAGLGQAHGLRHGFAQWRYKMLTGWDCPAAGGKSAETMTTAERSADYEARLQVSLELGHHRIDVTDAYLGRRWAEGHFRRAVA